jgi:hypothetical protein
VAISLLPAFNKGDRLRIVHKHDVPECQLTCILAVDPHKVIALLMTDLHRRPVQAVMKLLCGGKKLLISPDDVPSSGIDTEAFQERNHACQNLRHASSHRR